MKKISLGIENFQELIQKYYFIDKSYFIANILDNLSSKVAIFTRPRRFGKTLILSMIEYFFSLEDAAENRKLFNNLIIARLDHKYMTRQGSTPVIFISLKDIFAKNFYSFIRNFSIEIADLYDKYNYLATSNLLSSIDKDIFNQIYTETPSEEVLKKSLKYLTEFLAKHYNKKVILLIDEYDTPIISAFENGYHNDCIEFMRGLYTSALKTNEYVDFTILTGITQISNENIFSELNNFVSYSTLSDDFSDIFGFTQEDVNQLAHYYNLDSKIEEIKSFYDGYLFGKTKIYNPWSINNYIDNNIPMLYWINTSSNIILNTLLKNIDEQKRNDLENLATGNCIEKYIDETLVYNNITPNDLALFSTLYSSGYLKIVEKKLENDIWLCKLKIPNKEILALYIYDIIEKIFTNVNVDQEKMHQAIISGQFDEFRKILNSILTNAARFYNTQESFYHGLLLGLTISLKNNYTIKSNCERDYSCFDLSLLPKTKEYPGIFLEFKVSETEGDLQLDAKYTLEQIESKNYSTEFNRHNITNIWEYGIALFNKNIFIQDRAI